MQNNVDVKQDLKSNQSLVIPGGEEVEGYGGGGDHMAFRGGTEGESVVADSV